MSKDRATGPWRPRTWRAVMALALCGCTAPAEPGEGTVAIRSEVVQCPVIRDVSAVPLEVVLGGTIAVSAMAAHGTPRWHATSGTFADPDAETTTYRCESAGEQVLTFTLTDGPECDDEVEVQVQCSLSPSCGDGHVDRAEQCDDGNVLPDDGCSPHCALEVD